MCQQHFKCGCQQCRERSGQSGTGQENVAQFYTGRLITRSKLVCHFPRFCSKKRRRLNLRNIWTGEGELFSLVIYSQSHKWRVNWSNYYNFFLNTRVIRITFRGVGKISSHGLYSIKWNSWPFPFSVSLPFPWLNLHFNYSIKCKRQLLFLLKTKRAN